MALTIFTGPMFAGKTTALLQAFTECFAESKAMIKPAIDTRYESQSVVSHDGESVRAQQLPADVSAWTICPVADAIFIDEIQFFSEEICTIISGYIASGRNVYAAGLKNDYKNTAFTTTAAALELASAHTELFARCDSCSEPAEHTARRSESDSQKQVQIGGKEAYFPACSACFA